MQGRRIQKTAALLQVPWDKIRLFLGGYHWTQMEDLVFSSRECGYGVLYKDGTDISVEFDR
jgi:hypothetical protein